MPVPAQVCYDRTCQFWALLWRLFNEYGLLSGKERNGWMQFYACQIRFFRQMLMAAKVRAPDTFASAPQRLMLQSHLALVVASKKAPAQKRYQLL